jgi:hypothetical protein
MKTARRQKDEGHRVAREECDTKKGDDAPGVGRMTNIAIRTVGDHSWVLSTRKMREKARPMETIEWRRRAWPSAKRPVPKSTIGSRSTEEGPRPSISRRPRKSQKTPLSRPSRKNICLSAHGCERRSDPICGNVVLRTARDLVHGRVSGRTEADPRFVSIRREASPGGRRLSSGARHRPRVGAHLPRRANDPLPRSPSVQIRSLFVLPLKDPYARSESLVGAPGGWRIASRRDRERGGDRLVHDHTKASFPRVGAPNAPVPPFVCSPSVRSGT